MIKFVNDTGQTVLELKDEESRPEWVICPTCGGKIRTRWLVSGVREDIYRVNECQCHIRKETQE